MSTSLPAIFAADTHLADGQLLLEDPTANRGKYPELRERTLMGTVSSKEEERSYKWRLLKLRV
jgi:hypothetical protein